MISKQKGTLDIYGEYGKKWNYVNEVISSVFEKYNYSYILYSSYSYLFNKWHK